MRRIFFVTAFFACTGIVNAQKKDTIKVLPLVKVTGYRTMNGIGHFEESYDNVILAGKKNELLTIDSLDANKAIGNTRQLIGRVPGLSIIETESGGFTANGIAFRGLNPYQSIEMNTRQNGYNISADIFGYNESYYTPPAEAVQSIQLLRGSAGLQFGPQIGGMVNYILKNASAQPIEITVSQTAGSFGLYNNYTSLGGTLGRFKYFSYVQYRVLDGWRHNSDQRQLSGYAKLSYDFSNRLQASIEYTALRNKIHMPGGLTDSMFAQDPKQSTRLRNWIESPWNVLSGNISYKISNSTTANFKSTYLFSARNLVWRNEDGWPYEQDTITPSLGYTPRELEKENFKSVTNELRVLSHYNIGSNNNTIAFGIRHAYSRMNKLEHADGSTGTDADYTPYSEYEEVLHYTTQNIAPFAENIFNIGKKFSITPGIRFEYLSSTVNGITEDADNGDEPLKINKQSQQRTFLLAGAGLSYKITQRINAYGNYSQSYRPVAYSDLTPFGSIAKVDADLKDAKADNIDAGIRGQVKNILNFDISFFYLNYTNRIGIINAEDANGNIYPFRTNTGSSRHTGIESYTELNISKIIFPHAQYGKLSIYNSLGYTYTQYTKGEYKGNRVEYAPRVTERFGINYWYKGFALNAQYSYQGKTFGDAANTAFSEDALTGINAAYSVIDFSASYKLKHYQFKCGVNNLANKNYFTLRTAEYPGPGIIPSIGRMVYAGLSVTL